MARFRFKAVAPSSEVVEGELEAQDRQSAIGKLRELNHLPVRVEEMRDSPQRRRERAERIEPMLSEPPKIDVGRPEPQLKSNSPIVRLREVLRTAGGRGEAEPSAVAPPPEQRPEPHLESAPREMAPGEPGAAEPPPVETVGPADDSAAASPDAAGVEAPPDHTEAPAAVSSADEPGPSPAAPPGAAAVEFGRDDEPYPPVDRRRNDVDEPLPIRWDASAAEAVPPPARYEGGPDPDSSADRWIAEIERERGQTATGFFADERSGREVVPFARDLPPDQPSESPAELPAEFAPSDDVEAVPAAEPPPAERKPKANRRKKALPARLLPVFTRELQVLLAAGLPMDQALRIIVESTADDRVAAAADGLLARVRGGALLSEAMEALPGQFDEFLRTAVRAGEAGGSLAEVLDQVAQYQERGQKLEQSVKTALIYPTILAFAATFSVVLLLTLVVPQFESLLRQSAQTPPLATRAVISASVYLRQYGWIFPAGGLLVWLLARWRYAGLRPKAKLHRRLLRLPLIGKVLSGVAMERLARALGTLLSNGVPLPEALKLVAEAVPNRAVGAVTAAAAERVKQGERLADALEDSGVLPPLAVQLIRVGEEGGSLSDMLARLAEIYAGDVDVAVRRVTAVIEPALILLIGIVVGGIVLSLLAAITGLNTLAL